MLLPADVLAAIHDLYRRGLYLQAWRAGAALAPLKEWQGPDGRVMASRLATHLGAPRLSLWHRLKSWRESPDDPEVRYYYAWAVLEYGGAYEAWRLIHKLGDMPQAPRESRSSWYALHAQLAATFRDFDAADGWMRRALDVDPESPWVHVTRAHVLEHQDRYDDALAAADHALSLQPWFRPAVQARAQLLTLSGRNDESFDFLKRAAEHLECAAIYWQIAGIELERENFAGVRDAVGKFEDYSPLLERHFGESFHLLRSFLAYRLGDDDGAIDWARKADGEFGKKIVERLQDPARKELPRVTLPVGFVRQHHKTCVPATLTTVSRYWQMPAEHLAVAEEICYDGTSSHAERKWAETNGWAAREFTVTEAAARALIDAGAPFTLTTTDPGNGHLQAVIGYDARRGSIIIRDPYVPNRREAFGQELLEDYRAFGPRGMAMVPAVEAGRLASLDLPDAALWDRLHRIDGMLNDHQRDEAAAVVAEMEADAPGHLLTLHGRRRIAVYDSDLAAHLATIEALLEQCPKNPVLQLMRLSLLRNLARHEDRLKSLKELAEQDDAHPAFEQQYAQELTNDAREYDRAIGLLKKLVRRNPHDAVSYYLLAGILWDRREFDEALDLYRIAASLDDKDEQLAEAWFRAAQHCRQTDLVLNWLRRRFERFGRKSSLPGRTLEAALWRLERTPEALAVLDEAMRLRPDDGELILYAANSYGAASSDYSGRATELLERARNRSPRGLWLQTAARFAQFRGDLRESLTLHQELARMQPLSVGAHQAVAHLLSEVEGQEAALAHLKGCVDRFPHHQPLWQLYIEWLREATPEDAEAAIRRLIELNPAHAWAVRELGFLLVRGRRLDEAERLEEESTRLDPGNAATLHLRGDILSARGRMADARDVYRAAVRMSVDNDYAMGRLIECCDTNPERRAELDFIRSELVRQTITGDGLLAYRNHAHMELDPEELLSTLRDALAARPDLWHAWAACVRQLVAVNRLEEAGELAKQATERFPLLPRLWLDRATVCRVRLDEEGELAALEAAHRINPTWSDAVRPLSDVYFRRGDFERAKQLMESAIASEPTDGVNRGWLAEILWRMDQREAAIQQIEKAVELQPGYDWAWGVLGEWSADTEQPDRPLLAARRLVERRPGETRSWLLLGRMLTGDVDSEGAEERLVERLAAFDKAIALNPRCVDAYSQKAKCLAQAGRHEEAVAACRPTVWGDEIPAELQAREAWIDWERGRKPEAIERLKAACAADPSMYGAWQKLADWQDETGDRDGYAESVRQMVRLDPHNRNSLGYLGEVLLRQDDRAGAKEAFRRAFESDPSYGFAGLWLFDLQIEDDEWGEAAETLTNLHRHNERVPFTIAREVQVAVHRREADWAFASFEELCAAPLESDWPIRTACRALRTVDEWRPRLQAALDAALALPEPHEEVGALWADLRQNDGVPTPVESLRPLSDRGALGERALYAWVVGYGRHNRKTDFVRFIQANRDWLLKNDSVWGAIAYAWTQFRDWKAAPAWIEDWRSRAEAKPWMLVNVAEILRAARRDAEAAEVSRHALALPREHGVELHEIWLAVDAVTDRHYGVARSLVADVDRDNLDEDYRFVLETMSDLLELEACPTDADRRRRLSELQAAWKARLKGYSNWKREPARRRFYRVCVGRVAELVPTLPTKLWSWTRRLATLV